MVLLEKGYRMHLNHTISKRRFLFLKSALCLLLLSVLVLLLIKK